MNIQQKAQTASPTISFEDNFAALEQVVSDLEKGDLTLDDAIALFEQGMLLAKACNDQLDAAELRISQLRGSFSGLAVEEVG